jgi:cell division transport system permease protein
VGRFVLGDMISRKKTEGVLFFLNLSLSLMEKGTHKKKLGGYPATGVVISTTLALFVIGLFGLLLMYSQQLEKKVRENIRMQVYLKSNVSETQRLEIKNRLLALDYVSKAEDQALTFVSKEEAAKTFIAETGEDFTTFLGENPLRDAYLVSIDPKYHSRDQMEKIKVELQKLNGVFQVFYVEGLIEAVNDNITNIALVLVALIVILLITVALLINNTLRIALFSQRFLIRSMQLVGAKRWFIQRPFLMRAAGYGLLSGVVASIVIWLLSDYAQQKVADLQALHDANQFMMLVVVIIFMGIVVAVLSTFFSIRKYLRMSLEELY